MPRKCIPKKWNTLFGQIPETLLTTFVVKNKSLLLSSL